MSVDYGWPLQPEVRNLLDFVIKSIVPFISSLFSDDIIHQSFCMCSFRYRRYVYSYSVSVTVSMSSEVCSQTRCHGIQFYLNNINNNNNNNCNNCTPAHSLASIISGHQNFVSISCFSTVRSRVKIFFQLMAQVQLQKLVSCKVCNLIVSACNLIRFLGPVSFYSLNLGSPFLGANYHNRY